VKAASGAPRFVPVPNVPLEDQFERVNVDVRKPLRLCVPVNKNGEDPGAPANPNALLCYTTSNDKLPFPQKTVLVTNQFDSFTETLTQYDELCVPSTIL